LSREPPNSRASGTPKALPRISHNAVSIAEIARVAMPEPQEADAARSFAITCSVRSGSSPLISSPKSSIAALSARTSLPPNPVTPMPSMPSSVCTCTVKNSRSIPGM
jgi:hypothetical protein